MKQKTKLFLSLVLIVLFSSIYVSAQETKEVVTKEITVCELSGVLYGSKIFVAQN